MSRHFFCYLIGRFVTCSSKLVWENCRTNCWFLLNIKLGHGLNSDMKDVEGYIH
jgi:hypothetical protein